MAEVRTAFGCRGRAIGPSGSSSSRKSIGRSTRRCGRARGPRSPCTRRPHIRLSLPFWHPLSGTSSDISLRANASQVAFRHIVRAGTFDASYDIVEQLRDRFASRWAEQLPDDTEVRWHAGSDRRNAANDQLQAVHPGGYETLTPESSADWAIAACNNWATLLTDDPPADLPPVRGGRPSGVSADVVCGGVRIGAWATP